MPEPKSALNDTSGSEREPPGSPRSSLVSDGTRRSPARNLTGSLIILRSGSLIHARSQRGTDWESGSTGQQPEPAAPRLPGKSAGSFLRKAGTTSKARARIRDPR